MYSGWKGYTVQIMPSRDSMCRNIWQDLVLSVSFVAVHSRAPRLACVLSLDKVQMVFMSTYPQLHPFFSLLPAL